MKGRQAGRLFVKPGESNTFDGPGEYVPGVQQTRASEDPGLVVSANRKLDWHPTSWFFYGRGNGQFDLPEDFALCHPC